MPFKGMNQSIKNKNSIEFNSLYEGGNLDCVVKVDEN